jgi:transglutaminase-like putative cysteine protease
MAIRVALNHKTEYRYDRPVELSAHIIRLRPAAHSRTPVHSYSLKVSPAKHFINWQQDPFGNYQARVVFPDKTDCLSIEVDLVAELVVINPFDFFLDASADHFPFGYEPQLARELVPFLELREDGPRLRRWLDAVERAPRPTIDFLVALNQRLQQDISYNVRMEAGVQSCEETLTRANGSCRDSAWLLVQVLRHLGLAARFVSGYLVQLTADQKSLDGPSGPEHDFTDLHAWAEVYVPGAGWLGLDPTSGLFAGEGHIPLACTPDPVSAAPVTGASDEAEVTFYFHNQVQRIREDPRVTRPYSEAQWAGINALGHQVDDRLQQADVRLTMGGEPTFVSIDDMDGAQWNTAALGAQKLVLAGKLLGRLQQRFAPGGALHYGQGKWYPGELLPRWALSVLWRADGVPVWTDPRWSAAADSHSNYTAADARRFTEVLCRHLGLDTATVQPGYEDVFYYLWKEGRLPDNVDVLDSKLDDPLERARLRRLFDTGLDRVTGHVLPLKWRSAPGAGGWASAVWHFRGGHLLLLPGDSAMGYRLPLDSLAWTPEQAREREPERCTFEPRPELGDVSGEVARRYSEFVPAPGNPPGFHAQAAADDEETHGGRDDNDKDGDEADARVYSALCVEPRDGRLYVFLPPLTHLEHYLDLVSSIEASAAELQMPVIMEGYEPPRDHRLLRLAVTPDPGVIEVNIHPAASWTQLHDTTLALYEEARLTRLGTEKFMLDGRHTGTGGGNHVTIGGATPADSPVLRRPDLLRSLLGYWQNHPGLSYLFSGLFLGPTGQAPRVDEARDDSLYELEIAFQQMPAGEVPAPWLVARSSASTNCIRPIRSPAGSGWSSSAPSRCRRTRT